MPLDNLVVDHLAALVGYDTRNPPREITQDGIFAYLKNALPGFTHTLSDHGDGCISLLSKRGSPKILFNFHIDTVPSGEAWQTDPWTLQVNKERVTGLGACDIKGASAAMLAAAVQTSGDLALLFTSDEEAGNSHCVREFIAHNNEFSKVVVAEPTKAQAVVAHRGIVTGTVNFSGTAGHASAQQGVGASAVHQAIAWGRQALDWAGAQDQLSFENLQGLRFNIGIIKGGIKPNIIAASAELKFGLRSLPGMDQSTLISQLQHLTQQFDQAVLTPGFIAPALNAQAGTFAEILQVPTGPAVDYWTEAALFAEAGFETFVFGPGDIAQAHTANEWVSTAQLTSVANHYQWMIQHGAT